MAEQRQIFEGALAAAPKDYKLSPSIELILKAVTAEFVDAGAAGDWLPCVELVSDSGHTIARAVDQGVKVTAGSDAEVSWFPGVKHATGGSSTTGVLPQACECDGPQGGSVVVGAGAQGRIDWSGFLATDTGTFGTNNGASVLSPITNTAGDSGLVLQREGAYLAVGVMQWDAAAAKVVSFVDVGGGEPMTQLGNFTNIAELQTVAGATTLYNMDVQLIYSSPSFGTGFLNHKYQNHDGVSHTITQAVLSVFYLGGPGTELNSVF